jgi:hypothetical protein
MRQVKAKDLKQWDTLNNYAQINQVIQLEDNKVQVFLMGSNHGRIVPEDKLIEVMDAADLDKL